MSVIARINLERIFNWLSVVAALLGLDGILVIKLGSIYELAFFAGEPNTTVEISATEIKLADLSNEQQLLSKQVNKLESAVGGLANIPLDGKIALKLKTIQGSLDKTKSEVAALDNAIMKSPEKALEMPLLRRDMDNMKETERSNIDSLKAEIDRVYGLGEWFIGLMATMAIGVLSLAITNFLSQGEK